MLLLKISADAIDSKGFPILSPIERKAQAAINKNPQHLIIDVADLMPDNSLNGTAVLGLRNLLIDGLRISLFYDENTIDEAKEIVETIFTIGLNGVSEDRRHLVNLYSKNDKNLKNMGFKKAITLSAHRSEFFETLFKKQILSLETIPLSEKKQNYRLVDYELSNINGFLIWLHLKNMHENKDDAEIKFFHYPSVRLFFEKGVNLKYYPDFYHSHRNKIYTDWVASIEKFYESTALHFKDKYLTDLHNHPSSCISAEWIIEKINARPHLDFERTNSHPLVRNRLKVLGYSTIQEVAHKKDLVTMRRLITESLDGTASLEQYLVRVHDILKLPVENSSDLIEITYELSTEAYQNYVKYVELRVGVLRKTWENSLTDDEIKQYEKIEAGKAKTKKLKELLEKTKLVSTLFAYFEGMYQFKKENPSFDFNLLLIIDKRTTALFFKFIAEQIVDLKRGFGIYSAESLLEYELDFEFWKNLNLEQKIDKLKIFRKSIIGFDTAGPEFVTKNNQVVSKYDPGIHAETTQFLKKSGLFSKITSHAGEDNASIEDGISAIDNEIEKKGVDTIGHGIQLAYKAENSLYTLDAYNQVYDAKRIVEIKGKQQTIMNKIIKNKVMVEANFSSNLQTGSVINPFKHPADEFSKKGVKIILGTDGTSINNTQIIHEIAKMHVSLGMERHVIEKVIETGQKIVKKIIDSK